MNVQYQRSIFGRTQTASVGRRKKIRLGLPLILLAYLIGRDIRFYSATELIIGLIISAICIVPSLIWAYRKSDMLPSLQLFFLAHLIYYGYPILSGKRTYLVHSENARLIADFSVMLFLGIVFLIYYVRDIRISTLTRSLLRRIAEREIPDKKLRSISMNFMIGWVIVLISRNFGLLSYSGEFANTIWSVGSAGGTISSLVLFRLYGANNLNKSTKMLTLLLSSVGIIIYFATGLLIYGAIFFIVAVLGYSLGRGRIPWTAVIVGVLFIAFLHVGKADMRQKYWAQYGPGTAPSIDNLIDIYTDWLSASFDRVLESSEDDVIRNPRLIERSSLMQMQTLVTDMTPDIRPFLRGVTYTYVPQVLIPRFIWANKPHGHIATEVLGIYYGIQTSESVKYTSIGFGMLAEAWANFGWLGVVLLGVFFGLILRFADSLIIGLPYNAFLPVMGIIWLTWCFQLENALSSWLGSLIQTLMVSALAIYPFTSKQRSKPGRG